MVIVRKTKHTAWKMWIGTFFAIVANKCFQRNQEPFLLESLDAFQTKRSKDGSMPKDQDKGEKKIDPDNPFAAALMGLKGDK